MLCCQYKNGVSLSDVSVEGISSEKRIPVFENGSIIQEMAVSFRNNRYRSIKREKTAEIKRRARKV